METAIVALRVVLALACVLGLIWYAGRKLAGTPGARRQRTMPLTVIGRQSLGKGAGVALIEVAGRVLLLGIGEQGVRVLTEIETPVAGTAAVLAAVEIPGLVPDVPVTVLREELDLAALTAHQDSDPDAPAYPRPTGPDGSGQLANLAALSGLAASSSVRGAGPLHGSILSPDTWRRAVDVVQQRTVRR